MLVPEKTEDQDKSDGEGQGENNGGGEETKAERELLEQASRLCGDTEFSVSGSRTRTEPAITKLNTTISAERKKLSQKNSTAMETDTAIHPDGEVSQNSWPAMKEDTIHPDGEDASTRPTDELLQKMDMALNAVREVQCRLELEKNGDPCVHKITRELAQEYKDRAEEYFRARETYLRAEEHHEFYGGPTHVQIRQIHRFTCYYLQHMESYFPLPAIIFVVIDYPWEAEEARTYMSARIAWVDKQRRLGTEPYPQQGRYTCLLTSTTAIRDALSEEKMWILDFAHLPPLELEGLMCLTHRLNNFLHKSSSVFGRLPFKENFNFRDVITPWTKEALHSGHHECEICRFKFDTKFSDEECVEPAIKAACGHVLGEMCTCSWVESGNRDCPICRRPLFDLESTLPTWAVPDYQKIKTLQTQSAELDPRIDSFFQQKPQVCNGLEMKHVIETQYSLLKDLKLALDCQSSMMRSFYCFQALSLEEQTGMDDWWEETGASFFETMETGW